MTMRSHPKAPFLSLFSLLGLALGLPLASCSSDTAEGPVAASGEPSPTHLVVLHTNDLHGQVLPRPAPWLGGDPPPLAGGIARVAAYIERVRQEVHAEDGGLVVVDGGDWFQGTPEGLLEDGLAYMQVIDLVGYDALAVGNHEFDNNVDNLSINLGVTGLKAVCANVLDNASRPVAGAHPYRIVQRGGLDIALVGLITPSAPDISHPSVRRYEFLDPAETLSSVRAAIAKERTHDPVELVIPITHLGLENDKVLAKAHSDLPLIVGGHSHTVLKEGLMQGDVLIVQAGSKASAVGRVDMWIDKATGEVLERKAQLVDLTADLDDEVPAKVKAACERLVQRASSEMDEPVGNLDSKLERSRKRATSSSAGNLVADVLRARGEAQVGVQNRGGLRCDIDAGQVTRREVFELLPFGNTLMVVELTGEQLEALLRRSVEGMAHSELEVSGVEVLVGNDEGSPVLVQVQVDGQPLRASEVYKVATNSFLASGGDGYIEFVQGNRTFQLGYPLRQLVEERLHEGPYTPITQQRYRHL